MPISTANNQDEIAGAYKRRSLTTAQSADVVSASSSISPSPGVSVAVRVGSRTKFVRAVFAPEAIEADRATRALNRAVELGYLPPEIPTK